MNKRIALLVADGFEELEAMGAFALLRRAGLTVDVFTLRGTTACGKFGLVWSQLKEFPHDWSAYDALVLPGGPHYQALEESPAVQTALAHFMQANKTIGAICAAPTLLGHAGFLKGKRYTCFTSMNEDFGGTFTNEYTTIDGNLITAKSAAAAVEFGLALVEKIAGPQVATAVKQQIYYEAR